MEPNFNMAIPRLDTALKNQDKVTEVGPMHFLVQSRTDANKFYSIDLRTGDCSCPDATYRGVKCWHIRAAEAKAGIYG